jgi:hypothetical protein
MNSLDAFFSDSGSEYGSDEETITSSIVAASLVPSDSLHTESEAKRRKEPLLNAKESEALESDDSGMTTRKRVGEHQTRSRSTRKRQRKSQSSSSSSSEDGLFENRKRRARAKASGKRVTRRRGSDKRQRRVAISEAEKEQQLVSDENDDDYRSGSEAAVIEPKKRPPRKSALSAKQRKEIEWKDAQQRQLQRQAEFFRKVDSSPLAVETAAQPSARTLLRPTRRSAGAQLDLKDLTPIHQLVRPELAADFIEKVLSSQSSSSPSSVSSQSTQ